MTAGSQPKRSLLRRKSTLAAIALLAVALIGYSLSGPEPPSPRGSGEFMQAIVYREYGPPDVLRLERTERWLPEDHQVVIEVRAASANPLDWHYMRGTPYLMRMDSGWRAPKSPRLGADVAGVVVEVGKNVTRFKPGDEVFGTGGGTFAEYVRSSETKIVRKPADVTFEQAAAIPVAALTALQGLRDKGHLQPGQKVLINGASGGVGTFAVQIAKALGAEVTGVCSTRNLGLVRSLGADHVVDYTSEDVTQGAERYDLILDNVGTRPLLDFRRVMKPDGIFVIIGGGGPNDGKLIGPMARPLQGLLLAPFVSQQFVMLLADINDKDLTVVRDMIAAKKLTPVIDRTYPLSEVPDAIRYLEEGHARGKVVITVATDGHAS
jgi:NADPH:quinone reductase-like Zn-dependent oxidoreductase